MWGKEESLRQGKRERKPVWVGEERGKTAKDRDQEGPTIPNKKVVTCRVQPTVLQWTLLSLLPDHLETGRAALTEKGYCASAKVAGDH